MALPPSSAHSLLGSLLSALDTVLHGKPEVVRAVLVAVLARGHVLIEDVPGVGKTTLAHALAQVLGCSWRRLQFTSDLLPADVLGVSIYDAPSGEFRFRAGPVFTQVLLADEVNRATPKTQGCLLEAMNEGQVSVDGVTRPLPQPFLVLATQNPLEHHGTFPLPESQLDRFLFRIRIGYPHREAERRVLREGGGGPGVSLPALTDPASFLALQALVQEVSMHRDLEDYLLQIVEATRRAPDLAVGVSPRGTQAFGRAARAAALVAGRNHVVPDDIKGVAVPLIAHRIVPLRAQEGTLGDAREMEARVARIVASIPPPV